MRPALLGSLAAVVCAAGASAQMLPISVSGFNRDIVVENTAVPAYFNYAFPFDSVANAFYERNLPGSTKGLPAGGAFTSVSDASIRGQMAPYTQDNVLLLDESGASGTLSLDAAAQGMYDALAVFASSANGGGTGTLVVNFADGGSSASINFNAQDWFNVTTNNALNNLGRVNLSSDAFDDASANNPRIYQTVVNLATLGLNTRVVSSITFTKPAASLATAVFGVSGQRALTSATPIEATGWNRDIVAENTATPPYAAFAQSFDTFNNYSWYERGLATSTKGLPIGGAFSSASNPHVTGQLQPYAAPNALFLDAAAPTASLTIAPGGQRPYEFLVVFASSSNQGGLGTLVITFSDSSVSEVIPFNAQDWFNVTTNNALNNLGRLNLNSDAFDDASAGNPRIYQTVLDMVSLGYADRAVASISFTKPNVGTGAQNTVIMALSGQPVPGVTGACTFPDGTCGLLPAKNCAAAGGKYQGDKTDCPPSGACIAASGDCSIRTEANCAFVGGTFLGDNTTCPLPGPCIAGNGDCTQLNEFQCAAAGGTFLGAGQPCPPVGACCTPTGCLVRNQFQCAFVHGAFQGAGTSCDLSYPSIMPGGSAFEDISFTGTQVTTWTGSVDDGYAPVPIGFDFGFFNGSYSTAFVGTNGLITFGAGSTAFTNTCLPTAGAPNNGAYPLWDDYHLHPSHTGRVFYQTLSSPTRLIVQWDLVGHYNAGQVPIDQSTFQAVLFENGAIEYRYALVAPVAACGAGGAGASVGIENADGTAGLNYDATLLSGGMSLAIQSVSPCPSCRADFNNDGSANSQDFFDFLTAFFKNAPNADFNRDGAINSQDFFDFLTAFFQGC
jgi:hypothetical membrane protein